MTDISEKNFEATIEQSLLDQGYKKRPSGDYDRERCLIRDDVFDFILATQPATWANYVDMLGEEKAQPTFLRRLQREIERKGTVHVLRKGIRDRGCTFQMAYFTPETGLNPELQRQYEANRFTVVRQLRYSTQNNNSLDLTIFLNGLPIFTAELKEQLTSQDVEDARRQYKETRDPREPLFAFRRVLAHFAVDPSEVYYTTRLRREQTRFLPFNRGDGTGAGNPPAGHNKFATAYLWEQIWSPDSVLNLVQHFIHTFEETDDKGRKERMLIFPRYHQIDAVRRLVGHAREHGAGERYLIQHSAGSGKSFSIAWLAHQLAGLHDSDDRRIFHSVIVVTDRRVLDEQIRETVHEFEQTVGLVAAIDKHSSQLQEALEAGKQIIVTTLQKFPFVVEQIEELAGSRFAVIVDEAHSSQSGEMSKTLKQTLSVESLEDAEAEEADADEYDMAERVNEEMRVRGRLPNVSFFAFTATPKARTLELFGTRQPDGSYAPFSLYSMRQAIEEEFIMDVLENYTTYRSYFHLLKKAQDDPKVDKAQATAQLKRLVDLHPHAIRTKTEIVVDHFVRHVQHRIAGRAKAMIVTRSRKHCVRYKLAVDRYINEQGFGFEALVAFSGEVKDQGDSFTERSMNGFPDSQTADRFKKNDLFRIMIVANKFQTGFDVPLLHTMYVDKKLGGVNAVQTLSRLNRTHPRKDSTMVLDFANEPEHIEAAFQPFYEKTLLLEGTDPNYLYDLQDEILGYRIVDMSDVRVFAEHYYRDETNQARLHTALEPAVARYQAASEETQADFRSTLKDYVRRYAYLAQVIEFVDADLEMFYQYTRYLVRKLPYTREEMTEIRHLVDMDSYNVRETGSGSIELPRGAGEVKGLSETREGYSTSEEEPLSQIIRELNERYANGELDEKSIRGVVTQLDSDLAEDDALAQSVESNPPGKAKLSFEQFVKRKMQDMIDEHVKFYKRFADDEGFQAEFVDAMFRHYMETQRSRPG